MKNYNLKPGDSVLIRKPIPSAIHKWEISAGNAWVKEMDDYNGQKDIIHDIFQPNNSIDSTTVLLVDSVYSWPASALILRNDTDDNSKLLFPIVRI